jgi:hypothetical protein
LGVGASSFLVASFGCLRLGRRLGCGPGRSFGRFGSLRGAQHVLLRDLHLFLERAAQSLSSRPDPHDGALAIREPFDLLQFREGWCACKSVPNVYQAARWSQRYHFAELRLGGECCAVGAGFFDGGALVRSTVRLISVSML